MKPTQTPTPREQLDRLLTMAKRSFAFYKRGLLVFVVGALLVVPIVFTRPRDYTSETVVLYHETIHSTDLTGEEGGSEGARRVGARLRELLLSRASLEPIINDLHLYQDKIIHGELIGAVEEMRKHITFRARDGDTFAIAFVGSTPQEAHEVTKRLGECIIREADSRRADSAKTLKEFLTTESSRNQTELRAKENDLSRFVSSHPEFTSRLQGIAPQLVTPPGGGSGSTVRSADAQLASLEARAARIDRQLKAAAGQPPPPPPKVEPFQPPPDSQELVSARQDYADKTSRFTEKHPDVIAAKNRLKMAEQAQAAAVTAAREAWTLRHPPEPVDPPPPKNATDEAALQKELADTQAQILLRRSQLTKVDAGAGAAAVVAQPSSNVDLELEFTRLQREVNELRDRQQKLDERAFRAAMTASSVMNDRNVQVSVLDPAYVPVRPSSKPRTTLLAALLAVCLALAVAAMVVSALLDDRIYESVDIEKLDMLPVIAVIPRMRLPPKTSGPS